MIIHQQDPTERHHNPKNGKGITVLNSSETIDADYNGEIWFKLISLSIENFIMEEGERICRIIIGRHENASWERVGILLETYRGN